MNLEPTLLIYFSVAIAVLGLTAAVLTLSFLPVLRWIYNSYSKEGEKRARVRQEAAEILSSARQEAEQAKTAARQEARQLAERARREAEQLTGEAHQEAEKMLLTAKEKSQVMVQQTQKMEETARAHYEQNLKALVGKQNAALEKVSDDFINRFRHSLQEAEAENLTRFRSIADQISGGALSELEGFEGSLRGELLKAQQKLGERVEASYREAQKEIEEYKIMRLRKLDEAVFRIVFQVSEKVLGKALNLQEHQELVRQALHDITRTETAQP